MKKAFVTFYIFFCLIMITIYFFKYYNTIENVDIFGIVCIFMVILIPLVISLAKKNFDIFNPLVITNGAYFLYFVFTPFNDILTNHLVYDGVNVQPLIAKGNIYVIIGLIAMYLGYNSAIIKKIKIKKLNIKCYTKVCKRTCYVFYIITFLCFTAYTKLVGSNWLRFITLGRIGNSNVGSADIFNNDSPLTYYLLDTIDFAIVIYIFLLAVSKKKFKVSLLFFTVFLATVTIGFRYRIIIFLSAPIIYYFLKNKKRPKIRQIVVFIISIFILVGVVGGARGSFRTGNKVDNNTVFSFKSMYEEFMINNAIYHPFYGMIKNIPKHYDYFNGSSFVYILIAPIPKAIWKSKPQTPIKEIVYDSLQSEESVTAGRAFPNIGEFYANFGLAGIVIGMYLFGALQKLLYRYLVNNQDNIFMIITYSIGFPFILQYVSRGYFVQIFTEFVFTFLPVVFIWTRCKRHKKDGLSTNKNLIKAGE